jgi:8-oxo-dGTP pyrophosphatase MutT (NUDIX family)
MPIKRVKRNVVFENRWLRLYDDEIEHPDGTPGTYSWVERNDGNGGAIVVPRLPDGRILLLKMHRYVPGRWSWEFPGGGSDAGESAEQTARRELLEETGLQAAGTRVIGNFSSDTGFIRVLHTAVLAELAGEVEHDIELDPQESVIAARFMTDSEAWEMVASGDIFDGITITALGMLKVWDDVPPALGEISPGSRPRRLRSRLKYDSPWWRLYEDDIVQPEGEPGIYVRLQTTSGEGAVMVVPRTPSGKHLLIKIYRYPVEDEVWEFPAGFIEPAEDPVDAATRELTEETGLVANSAALIGSQYPVAGVMTDTFYIVLAEVPEIDETMLRLQAEEGIIEARFVTLEELRILVRANKVRDGVTLGAVARLLVAE